MLRELLWPHLPIIVLMLVSIAVPYVLVVHAQHARSLMVFMIIFTILWFVLYVMLSHRTEWEPMFLRCCGFSSALCGLVEELLSAREDGKHLRLRVLCFLGLLVLLTFGCWIGGVVGIL